MKDNKEILEKLGIESLNKMQEQAHASINEKKDVVLLSATGTGKTLAFLMPVMESLDPDCQEPQCLILVPSRELAIQIEQVCRDMGTGFKVNAVYGGRPISKDKTELGHPPALLIGTPGRVADHIRRQTVSFDRVRVLVLDEFDKSLEIGFEKDMIEIIDALGSVSQKILTSATQKIEIPSFIHLHNPRHLDFLDASQPDIEIRIVEAEEKDKLQALTLLLRSLAGQHGIIFCNFKDTIEFVSNSLEQEKIDHVCFYGGLEQIQRERALITFRNGTHRLMIATDLAARGIDVQELDFIIHYQLPLSREEFTHRNGRTARMKKEGSAFILKWTQAEMPDYVEDAGYYKPQSAEFPRVQAWETIFISGGRKDKISKGDIAGLFLKEGGLKKEELGLIELKQDCAFVAVSRPKAAGLVKKLDNSRLKKKKVRIRQLE